MVQWWRGRPFQPKEKVTEPRTPGAWVVTIRSVPLRYDELRRVVESTGEARVYFGEALAYLHGEAVALLRVEATGFRWVEALQTWWRQAQKRDGIPFDVRFYVRDREFVGSFQRDQVEELVERLRDRAPRVGGVPVAQ
ncbi:hypothetical protein OO015_09695 [Thermomicrobium sp. 4228-Ro]|uniref:hypothetical protein n=1 Tax=Thermomicrobium sp. 4228-Ro TaxID=2993937 RepID=UPI002248BB07|nr:hypothetical protein [Thermomicrobium sp. 4228-Ro]MCX2727758.1 hypothetical protein [Thermomicrobium sp. 4228-Ro]